MTPFATSRLTNRLSVVIVLMLGAGLIISLFLKERWLWMDEVISYVYVSDASLAHLNWAAMSGPDANPPLFQNLYWLLGHGISLNPQFLRAVSVLLFSITVALFYRYVTKLLGRPVINFVVVTLFVCLTYLNYTLATQVRSYALFGLLHWLYFSNSHRLTAVPGRAGRLAAQLLLGTALAFTHNFGLLYVAVMSAFFALLTFWSGRRTYWPVLAVQGGVGVIWLLGWFTHFRVLARSGQPHSWIALPTFNSFFRTVGELLPTVSAHLELRSYFQLLPLLRVGGMTALTGYLAWPRLRQGYVALVQDSAGMLLVQVGFVVVGTTALALVASFTVTSVFLSRYLWPNHLLLAFVVLYAVHHFVKKELETTTPAARLGRRWLLPAYAALLLPFVAYQNRKVMLFPSGILAYLSALNPHYPLFFESADYFLPVWYQHIRPGSYFLLDWPAALRSPALSSTVDYNILGSTRAHYHLPEVVPLAQFSGARFPHFYVVDEASHYQIEAFIASGRVRVVRVLPTAIVGHRILECVAVGTGPLAAAGPMVSSSAVP